MKTTYRLKITGEDFARLKQLVFADLPKEAGAFALAGATTHNGVVDICVRRPIAVPKALMPLQQEVRLEVASQAINGLIALCESNGLGAVICHSHPGFHQYSLSDDHGEERIANALRLFLPPGAPIASLLFSPAGITGRVWLPGKRKPILLSNIIIVGRSLQNICLAGRDDPQIADQDDIYDRQVRAFGLTGQKLIAQAKVGVVGVGGTGSPVAEQLVRLGVQDFVLIDPDRFDPSNLTRVYGSTARWVKSARQKPACKVDLVKANIRSINPSARVKAVPLSVVVTEATDQLRDRDVIFLCTDEHWGRSIVNQIAYQYLIPAINLGVRIVSQEGRITAAVGMLDVLRPDKPCLWCKQFLQADRIAAESRPRSQRQALFQEGYVDDIDTKTPSVISLTTTMAGIGVNQFLQLMTDFMGAHGDISRLTYNFLEGTTWRGSTAIQDGCICRKVRAFGDLKNPPTLPDLDYLKIEKEVPK